MLICYTGIKRFRVTESKKKKKILSINFGNKQHFESHVLDIRTGIIPKHFIESGEQQIYKKYLIFRCSF